MEHKHRVTVSPTGQITTSISGCPRELKKFLLIDGEPVVSCDISHAHHCFLPRLLADRIQYLRKQHASEVEVSEIEAERISLIYFLSDGDYYAKWCRDPKSKTQRKEKKTLLNMLLNWPNLKCEGNKLYRYMRRRFPITFGICEVIKAKDHRNMSKSLQHYTAEAINGALLKAQALGIPAIPDVDAIICPKRHRETVCRLIGEEVYNISGGVCCKVDEVRYEPVEPPRVGLTESTPGQNRQSGVATPPCGTCLTDCVPHVPISEALIIASQDIKEAFSPR